MSSLTISYARPAQSVQPLDLIKIEQAEWPTYTGTITKQEMIRYLTAALTGGEYESQVDCAMNGDAMECTIYAYPRVAGLLYRMLSSWGALSGPKVEIKEFSELVQFRLTTAESTQYPVRSIQHVDWADDCYDGDGAIVTPPSLSADNESVTCGSPVYGTATLRYLCERHTYELRSPRRGLAIDNNFSAVVVAVYDGGINYLPVKMPPGVEVFEADATASCGFNRRFYGSATWPDDEIPMQPSTASRETIVDYCLQKIISDSFF